MAQRRMISKRIIDTDTFLDMPVSARELYFQLLLRADDEGFVGNAKRIIKMIGATIDDLKVLIAKGFVIPFESGVIVITHWRIHNYIQSDRFQPTHYQEEKAQVALTNGVYTKVEDVSKMDTKCIQNVSKMDTQYSIGKDSIGKYRLDKNSIDNKNVQNDVDSPQAVESTGVPKKKKSSSLKDKKSYEEFVNEFFDTVRQQPWWLDFVDAFPNVTTEGELAKAKAWLLANTNRRKKDLKRYLYNWLSKAQDQYDRIRLRKEGVAYGRRSETEASREQLRLEISRARVREDGENLKADGQHIPCRENPLVTGTWADGTPITGPF